MIKENEIKWAPIIPLIGGFPLGAEKALGKLPEAIISYTGFDKNDSQYVNHMQNTRGLDIDYLQIDNEDHQDKIKAIGDLNIIVGTPPCAALSQLNTGRSDEVKGSKCKKNEYMYWVFRDGIEIFNADAIVIENAPALYTKKGQGVADEMKKLAKKYGYSLTLYKTSTHYHGVPQKRDRTFAIMWKSEVAPVMEWYKRQTKDFSEYLQDIPEDAIQQSEEDIINPNVITEPYYEFIKAYEGRDARQVLLEDEKYYTTCFNYVNKKGLLPIANEWFHENEHEKGIKYSDHALMKISKGLGIWDGSVHVFDKTMNAVIGRNLVDTIHPTEDRSLNLREAMHLMAFPHNFELVGGRKNVNLIAQNVPACTAADIVEQMKLFLLGELEYSNDKFTKQNNHKQTVDVGFTGTSLHEFM